MIERLVITIALVGVSALALVAFRQAHAWRIGRSAAAGSLEPRLLYFRSDYCAPCVTQMHHLDALRDRYENRLVIEKIDVETEADKASRYGVFTLPTTLVLNRQGDVAYINYGLTGAAKLTRQVERVL